MSSVARVVKKVVKTPFRVAKKVTHVAEDIIKPPKMPKVVVSSPPSSSPLLSQDRMREKKEEQKKKIRRVLIGNVPTILTSPLGLTDNPPTRKPTLLGG